MRPPIAPRDATEPDDARAALAAALEHAAGGRTDEALDALATAWRAWPSPAIAAVAERYGEAAAPPLGLAAESDADRCTEWLDAFGACTPSELTAFLDETTRELLRLLAARAEGRRYRERAWIQHRIDAACASRFARDPRVPRAALAWVAALVEHHDVTTKDWSALERLLLAADDPHAFGPLAEQYERFRTDGTNKTFAKNNIRRDLVAVLDELARRWPDAPSRLSPEAAALVDAIAARAPSRAGSAGSAGSAAAPRAPAAATTTTTRPRAARDLLAAVYDAPDDDAARLVYADWLLERGDPRGEFIRLQYRAEREALPRADRARMNALLKEHKKAWLGTLRELVALGTAEFRKGFAHAVDVKAGTTPDPTFLGAREWSTVRELTLGYAVATVSPEMKSLRRISSLTETSLAELAKHGAALPLEDVGLDYSYLRGRALGQALDVVGRYPTLRVVRLEGRQYFTVFDDASLDALWRWLQFRAPTSLATVCLRGPSLGAGPSGYGAFTEFVDRASARHRVELQETRPYERGPLWTMALARVPAAEHGAPAAAIRFDARYEGVGARSYLDRALFAWLAPRLRRVEIVEASLAGDALGPGAPALRTLTEHGVEVVRV